MKEQSGFTLVEVLVAGLVATMVTFATLSLVQVSAVHIQEGLAHSRLAMLSSAVSGTLSNLAYEASIVKGGEDPHDFTDFDRVDPPDVHDTLVFCDSTGDTLGGISITMDGQVWELTDPAGGWDWTLLKIAQEGVVVDPAKSDFFILRKRRGIRFKLFLRSALGDSLIPVTETMLCRRAVWEP